MSNATAKARYDELAHRRDPFLRRARVCAALTIPALLPPQGHNSYTDLPEPYQGLGARAVVNLSSRLMIAMYPPGMSSFRLQVPSEVLLQAGQMEPDEELERNLALTEKHVNAEIERRQWRQPTFLGLQYLIVTGNVLEQILPDNTIRIYRLDQYVVARDSLGNIRELIIEEMYSPDSLPERAQGLVRADSTDRVPLYTWVKREGDRWTVKQEVNGKTVPGSTGTYNVLPFNALRWTGVIGEDYGRGKVEEHIGDFRALEGLSKAVLDGAAMASLNIKMVRPNAAGGLNLRRRLAKANNGDWVVGNPEDVGMLQFENVTGIQIAQMELEAKKAEIAAAFLLHGAVRRDAERVTATEVRMMAEELEGTLGGVYSMLSRELQLHRLRRLIVQMQAQGSLPQWPEGVVEPTILTGIEALGREQDVQRVATALQFLGGFPEQVYDYIKWSSLLGKAFNGLSLPDSVHSEAEVQRLREQRAMQEAMAQAAQVGGQMLAQQAMEGGA